MTTKNTIGIIGLAVMGQNLARNFASRNIKTVVYNRTTKTMEDFIDEHGNDFLTGEMHLEHFLQSLEKPRKIFLMVKAGKPVDAVISQLLPLLDEGDILIDGGNSHFPDTIRREKELSEKEIRFVGCGVSGGEEGALFGPSLMPGGKKEAVEELLPYLQKIAAKDFSGNPCVSNIGKNGAGHYVKMVHNGIEYAVMQFLAEAYFLMQSWGMENEEIGNTFEKWNTEKLASFLAELSAVVVRKREGADFLIDKILDSAGQKGTGRWTAIDATDRGVAVPSIIAAVNARIFSSQKKLREDLAGQLSGISRQSANIQQKDEAFESVKISLSPPLEKGKKIQSLENALYLSMISAYSEGFWLISKAAEEQNWKINFAELARIWQGGCIIRANLLKFLESSFKKSNSQTALFLLPEITEQIQKNIPDLQNIVAFATQEGIPAPALSSALQHILQVITARGSTNFIQALRDAFGAHTFQRIDKEGIFHAEWSE